MIVSGMWVSAQEGSAQEGIEVNSPASAPAPAPSPQSVNGEIPIGRGQSEDKLIFRRLSDIYRNLPGLADVHIEVDAGVARLSGHTQSNEAHERAIDIAKRVEGVVSVKDEITLKRDIGQRLTVVQEKLWSQVNTFVSYIPLMIIASIVLFFFWTLSKFMMKWNAFYNKVTPNPFLQSLLKQTVRVMILFSGFVVMLEILDATALLGTILGVAGILGIAVGFAIRDTVENYIASILLSIRQPFRPRDHIVIQNYEGLVMKLTTRDTILMTLDGNHVRIPNATVYKSIILNYTRNPNRRFTFEVGIDTSVNIVAARTLALTTLKQSPGVIADPPPTCTIEKLGDSNVVLKMLAWTTQNTYDFGKVKSEAIRAVKEAFEGANYEMPEPIYRLKIQGLPDNGDLTSFQKENATTETNPSHKVRHAVSTDISKDNHIAQQISMEKEDGREMNLLVSGGPPKREHVQPAGGEHHNLHHSEKAP